MMFVSWLGLTEECIRKIKSFKTKPIADLITHEQLSEPYIFLYVLNKAVLTQTFTINLTELAVLSDPQIGNWPDLMISDDVICNKDWLHTHTINHIESRIIEGMKGGEAK